MTGKERRTSPVSYKLTVNPKTKNGAIYLGAAKEKRRGHLPHYGSQAAFDKNQKGGGPKEGNGKNCQLRDAPIQDGTGTGKKV